MTLSPYVPRMPHAILRSARRQNLDLLVAKLGFDRRR